MDFNQLHIFLTVAEELHFGRAAEKLHMAQPPVSRAVAQLEKSLGTRLFERSTRRVSLTATGLQLVQAGRRIVEAVEEAENLVQAAKGGDTGQIGIAFAGVSTHALIGRLSRGMKRAHPNIATSFMSQNFAQMALDRILRGEVDIGLGRWDFVPADVESRLVLEEKLVLAVPAHHRLAGAEGVSFRQLADEPFIELAERKSVLYDRLRRLAHQAEFEPVVVQEAPDTWTALALVGAEIGSTLTLDSVQANVQDDHIRFLPIIDDHLPVELRMAWLPGNVNPALPRVLDVAAEVWSKVDGN